MIKKMLRYFGGGWDYGSRGLAENPYFFKNVHVRPFTNLYIRKIT